MDMEIVVCRAHTLISFKVFFTGVKCVKTLDVS